MILITGGAGFVGRHLKKALEDLGEEVRVIDPKLHPRSTILSVEYLRKQLKGVDYVYHLGAASGSLWFEEPCFGSEINCIGTIRLLEECVKAGVKRVIFSSTSSSYAEAPIPHKEEHRLSAPNFYSATKIFNEHTMWLYKKLYGLDCVVFRFASIYGANENKGLLCNLVTQFVEWMKKDEQPEIWNKGTQTRDFTYVKDVVQALIMAQKLPSDTYNVSTNKETTFNEVVEIINELLGKDIKPKYIPVKLSDVQTAYIDRQNLDNSKLLAQGWKPEYDLRAGIKDAYL